MNKLLSLYLKTIGSPVDINGLMLYPKLIDDSIEWKLKNPNDLSYSVNVIEGHLEELLNDFMKMTGTGNSPVWKDSFSKYCRLGNNSSLFYINKELKNKVDKSCSDFNYIELFNEDEEKLSSDCHVMNWDIGYEGTDVFNFYISLQLSNSRIDGKNIDNDELSDFISDFIYVDTALEQELDLVWNIIQVIMDNKNMFDTGYMFSNAVIGYFDDNGNGLT